MSATTSHSHAARTESAWAEGVAVFGGVVLAMLGFFQAFMGLSAVLGDDVYVAGVSYVYAFDITAWGWIHMLVGIAAIAVGLAILASQTWANVVGIGIACISAFSAFLFLPYFPIWTMVIIAVDIAVIWALSTRLSR